MTKTALKVPEDTEKKPALTIQDLQKSLLDSWKKLEPKLSFVYAVILLLGLTFVVYLVSQTLNGNSSTSTVQNSSEVQIDDYSVSFDQPTISKIQELDDNSSSNTSITLPAGRINPFAE